MTRYQRRDELVCLSKNRKILLDKENIKSETDKNCLLNLFEKVETALKENRADHFVDRLPLLYLQIKNV
jgi:hypothetical protein